MQDKERWQQINKIVAFFDSGSVFAVIPTFIWLCYLILEDIRDIGWCGTGHAIRIGYVILIGTPVAMWAVYGVIRQWTGKGMLARVTRVLGLSYLIVYVCTLL